MGYINSKYYFDISEEYKEGGRLAKMGAEKYDIVTQAAYNLDVTMLIREFYWILMRYAILISTGEVVRMKYRYEEGGKEYWVIPNSIKLFLQFYSKTPIYRNKKAFRRACLNIKRLYGCRYEFDDILNEVILTFYNVVYRFSKNERHEGSSFAGYIAKQFHFYMHNACKKLIKDPLILKSEFFDMSMPPERHYENDFDKIIDIIDFSNYNGIKARNWNPNEIDFNWILGTTCGDAFNFLTQYEREIIYKIYIEGKILREVAFELDLNYPKFTKRVKGIIKKIESRCLKLKLIDKPDNKGGTPMSVTESYFRKYYESLYANKEIYVWGANHELITKELMDKLYKNFGSATYDKAYYNNKLKEGAGHYGSDCSGSFCPLSKADNTARGYYGTCSRKGGISSIPKDRCCMVFNSTFTHIGAYLGNGYTIEMRSSQYNCWKEKLSTSRWAYWGIPTWLVKDKEGEEEEYIAYPPTKKSVKKFQEWLNEQGSYGLGLNGEFNTKTVKAAVMEMQKRINKKTGSNVPVDGHFGSSTKAACPVYKNGSSGGAVRLIQAMLMRKGYNMSSSIDKDGMLDGEYGNDTEKAVTLFQSLTKGLKQDGEAGPATCNALFN